MQRGKVLVVEPDRILADTYAAALRRRGHDVVARTNAQDAILAADELLPDVVLLELQLTAHSGVEFLYELRSYTDWQAVPVIILSHVPPVEFQTSSKLLYGQLGVVAYHYKPRTSLRVMLHTVDDALAAAGRPESVV